MSEAGVPGTEEFPALLTATEAAKILRVSKMTVYRLIHAGELDACRVGGSFRIYQASARRLLATPVRHPPARQPREPGNGQPDAPAWIMDAWEQGADAAAIAKAAGLTRAQVRRILHDAGGQP